jgi:uncharacterized protein (TIGR03435 family)
MPIIRAAASVVFLLLGTLYTQPVPAPRFEVASIKSTPPDQWNGSSGGNAGKGKYMMHNRTLKTYIMRAYFVGPNQIVGGPPWLDSDRFDINAKADQPIDDDEALMAMLRTLLAQRCKLAIHHESKPIEAYALEVAKSGPMLEKAVDSPASATTDSGHGRIDARVISMKRFAEVLSRQMDLPVVDQTGLEGEFNLRLKWSPESDQPVKPGQLPSIDSRLSVFTAIQQLGLRLQARKTPVDVLVIDHVEMPSEN